MSGALNVGDDQPAMLPHAVQSYRALHCSFDTFPTLPLSDARLLRTCISTRGIGGIASPGVIPAEDLKSSDGKCGFIICGHRVLRGLGVDSMVEERPVNDVHRTPIFRSHACRVDLLSRRVRVIPL